MQITPILICLVLISIAQATLVTKIPKLKLNLTHSQNFKSPEIMKHKSPEERRKLSLFPKSYMKYVISSKPIYEIATHKPIVHGTKKPLMKKLNLQDKRNKAVENETNQPITNSEPNYDKNSDVIPNVEPVIIKEEVSIDIVEEKSEESKEKRNDSEEKEDVFQNVDKEFKTGTALTANKESLNVKDVIFPTKANSVEVGKEIKNAETFSHESDKTKLPKETETLDWTEFIFVNPAHKPTVSDKISSEESEEYVTTEFYEVPEIVRRKRGSNVIEEENLASTVAGYKYTWKDSRLNTDVAFKNIHS